MISRTKVVSIVLFLSVSILLVSCQKKKAEWKGTIEEVNGVTVVKNPDEPIYGENVFGLEEELSIGEAEGREEFMFSNIRNIAVDNEERIFILDSKEKKIIVFDRNGRFIKTFGRIGQGPGEFQIPSSVSYSSKDEIMVLDVGRLLFFSSDGEFKQSIPTVKARLGREANIDSEGNIFSLVIVRGEENPRYELQKFDPELNYLHSYGSSPLPNVRRDGYNPFFPVLRWDIIKSNHVICGYPENYEIEIFNDGGNLTRKIIKEYIPLEITKEEIDEETKRVPPALKSKISMPKSHTAYYWFIADDEGRIFVQIWERGENGEGYYYDIFDSEGKYIAKIPLKATPRVLKKNKLYTIEKDKEGFQMVKRYKITWNM